MRNWHDESVIIDDECPWIDDSNDAILLAEQLGIPFQVIDLSVDYKDRIVDYMFKEYESGRTPNPDVLCNREIKFDLFLKAAMDLGADYVATGHYCRRINTTEEGVTTYHLLAGIDNNKDQSYFLCQLNQFQLSKALFPIGELTKPEVRAIAKEQGFLNAEKKDSQGLCFIGKVKLPIFLQQQLAVKKGAIHLVAPDQEPKHTGNADSMEYAPYDLDACETEVIGEHSGAHFFTIGQRKGLHVGGRKEPLFVVGTDTIKNIVYVGEGDSHWALHRSALFIRKDEVHWLNETCELLEGEKQSYDLRIRYRQALQQAELERTSNGVIIRFEEAQRGVAPGQFAAWYADSELIGSGVINA